MNKINVQLYLFICCNNDEIGFQIGQELEEDPRVKVFKKEWFEGKDCLDIGCNCGLITISVGKYSRKYV